MKKPVGTSILYKSKDFASLYWVGVHPDYRRKGLGSALSFVPTEDAKDFRLSMDGASSFHAFGC